MKATCLLFLLLMASYAALMQETSYAASPQHASDKNHPHSRAGLTASNHPKQLSTSQKRPLPRNAASLRQPALARSGGAAKGGLMQNETTNRGLPVRLTSVRPSVASLGSSLNPLPDNVRHRGPNPAVVSGAANSGNRNTGAINGTGMHRRP
jgi:hypothetical protein